MPFERKYRRTPTAEAATNKLFRSALFELPESGRWEFESAVEGERGQALVRFEAAWLKEEPRTRIWQRCEDGLRVRSRRSSEIIGDPWSGISQLSLRRARHCDERRRRRDD